MTEIPGAASRSPATSSRALAPGRAGSSTFRYRQASRMPATQNGTFTQNMNRQLRWVKMAPPITGPRTGPSSAGSAT
jgi:hypothetical protein